MDIHDHSMWRGGTPHHSNFQAIRFGWSFKGPDREYPSPTVNPILRVTAPTPIPALEMGLQQWFCGFRFHERACLPFPRVSTKVAFQLLWPDRPNGF
ncbi:hypothetical protein AVEN_251103-1 [Araneus ventricosus]|uniref:Uncharacterized protein n=1 Tax=Araneus ventricosus TaxID=182803 RepID=A0A4Y2F4K3_ARAVE|nr:hypothetical protein AVEN_251103-1 [Araneus ventricosus]